MECSLIRRNGWQLATLCALLAVLVVGCRGGGIAELEDVAITARDVPADWVAADFDQSEARRLWDVLPDLLTENSEARLFLHAVEEEEGQHGVATILIETEEQAALPRPTDGDRLLVPLTRLLVRQDALLGPEVLGGDPGTYFGASDIPLPGSFRSRLVRVLDDGYLYSDSAIFTVGPVLAVVTVWYPKQDGPSHEVDDLASEVAGRLEAYLGQ